MADSQKNGVFLRSGLGGIKEIIDPLLGILTTAIEEGATDVHLDPYDEGKHVRFRVDGVVHDKTPVSMALRQRLLNQVKVLIDLDIDKSFVPEEGFVSLEIDGVHHDMRVTIAPIGDREAIHVRFLSSTRSLRDLAEIGMGPADLETVQKIIEASYGMILVTGGTGSGKTTTLYSLAHMLKERKQVVTSIEDPVEFRLPHVRQLEVKQKHGFSMYDGLRVILRMDPDVIMIGEIRDQQSAATAARAGLSGQLVMATMHARHPAMAINALSNMEVPRYVIGGALRLVIQQNLVLRVCPTCAREVELTTEARELFEAHELPLPETVREAVGCPECRDYGHKGRIAVFELTPIDRALGQDIAAGLAARELSAQFREVRRHSMMQDVLSKVADGVVAFDTAKRLLRSLDDVD